MPATALACLQRDAGDVPQRVPQVERGLLAHEVLSHDGHRLRDVEVVVGEPEEPGVTRQVAPRPLGADLHPGSAIASDCGPGIWPVVWSVLGPGVWPNAVDVATRKLIPTVPPRRF